MEQQSSRELRRRLRKTAAILVEDSSVRAELTDEQGKELIKWGMDLIEAEAAQTADLPDEGAMPLLEEKTTAVRTTMLLVNKLVRPGDSEEDTDDQLTRLLKNLTWVTKRPSGLAHLRRVEKFKKHREAMSQEEAFRLLMDMLQLDVVSDEEE
ncbi:MAG: hypothetical protein H6658_07370 [Ardenticatenaceae bacterium]|nr:hypothetical protein [Ardenticatenaceae bacterium]